MEDALLEMLRKAVMEKHPEEGDPGGPFDVVEAAVNLIRQAPVQDPRTEHRKLS